MALIEMSADLHGKGGLSEIQKETHNLSEASLLMVRAMMIGVSAKEFFQENKSELRADELIIVDESTGRKFVFTLTAKEL